MRIVSAKTISGAARQTTTPIYLVELQLSSPLYLCSYDTLTWNSVLWTANGVEVTRLEASGAEITLPNMDLAMSAVILGEQVRDKPAKIWMLYGDPPYADEDAVLMFSGYIDTVPPFDLRVTLTLTTHKAAVSFFPRNIVAPPTFNHLPKPGDEIYWGGQKLTI